jgi:hypothetical protein
LINNALAVRSIDLIFTLTVGVIWVLSWLIGLKFRIASMILFDVEERVWIRMARALSVAFTSRASLDWS